MTTKSLTKPPKQIMIENIRSNYRKVEKSIVEQLYMKHDLHGTTVGSNREDIWKQLFEMIIPKKFIIESSVFIIDSKGNVSREVDLAIMDETYTPYIFRNGRIKFIPIEAVAVVVECKSQSLDKETITEWKKSMSSLCTSVGAIARMAGSISDKPVCTQPSTRPIRVLCALQSQVKEGISDGFDIVLSAVQEGKSSGQGSIEINYSNSENLSYWFKQLNFHEGDEVNKVDKKAADAYAAPLEGIDLEQYKVYDPDGNEISLLTFNFQLNQLLMLINNPILFPHRAYAKLFDFQREGI
ncbi:DUF6602 domain-containing protein [Paenibacillus arenosi]|uniref:DUF6602 domain-containing protein n=1 Tax=Paenibacillus arenosi TaxID=2774142 RepID=A0ABR9B2A0_9BACL|nr:DUF6602 domain-containing protein [Paenibacillus arenosi]MBD8499552.1 hypothetical protein [Paenibacillus arenosi]